MDKDIIIKDEHIEQIKVPQGYYLFIVVDDYDLYHLDDYTDDEKPRGKFIKADTFEDAYNQSDFSGLHYRETIKDAKDYEIIVRTNNETKYIYIMWG